MNTPLPPPPPVADVAAPPVPAKRPWYRKKRFVIPSAFLALLVIAAALVEPDADVDPAAEASAPSVDGPSASTVGSTAATAPPGSREAPLPLGTAAQVGDYEVAVVAFVGDATDEVHGANLFNDAPDEDEVYSLVRLRVTYRGDRQGFPAMDLSVGYVGHDSRIYVDHDCGAVRPDSMTDQPEIVAGGSAEGNFCLRMPAAVVGTGAIFVEPLISFRDDKTWWAER
jgi:hypothetical protein